MNARLQLAMARRQANLLLIDTLTVESPSRSADANPFAPTTVAYAAVTPDPIAALIQPSRLSTTAAEPAGDTDVLTERYTVKLAVGSAVEPGDRLSVVSCAAAPELVGTAFPLVVISRERSSLAVLLRLQASRSIPAKIRR